ncbi:hypothetical protein INT45_014193 [Circinella minor]|uniref:Uncharacterized protein n=1 Tax=Circinella minor TaxID=1195481 RepID=A0A8H7RS84_9FUNG|nr:hypothetical protein INT45_014193 [Circinella minor]
MALNRPEYRDSKQPRAVKVYTIAQESRYLIFENVPALGIIDNLITQCQSWAMLAPGHQQQKSNALTVQNHGLLDTHASSDEFHDVVWVELTNCMQARKVKQMMDDKPFFTHILRVSYAPEYESMDDFRNKLQERYTSKLAAWQPRRKKQQKIFNVIQQEGEKEKKKDHSLIGPIHHNNSTLSSAQHNNKNNKEEAKKKRRRI